MRMSDPADDVAGDERQRAQHDEAEAECPPDLAGDAGRCFQVLAPGPQCGAEQAPSVQGIGGHEIEAGEHEVDEGEVTADANDGHRTAQALAEQLK